MENFHLSSNHIALQKWQPYLLKTSYEVVLNKIEKLKLICDELSAVEIECFWNRVRCHPPLEFRSLCKLNYRKIAENTRSEEGWRQVKKHPHLDVEALREEYGLNNVEIDDQFIRPEMFLYRSGLSFIDNPEAIMGNRVIIDGGAYRGESAVVMRKHYPDNLVHAFEPSPENVKVMRTVVETTKYGQGIVPVQAGLGSIDGSISVENSGHGTKIIRNANGAVKVVTIDSYLHINRLRAGCIKLDIEGQELDVIMGAEKTIKDQKPILLISIYHTPEDFFEIGPILKFWCPDYKLMVRHLHPQLTSFFGEFMLIAVPNR